MRPSVRIVDAQLRGPEKAAAQMAEARHAAVGAVTLGVAAGIAAVALLVLAFRQGGLIALAGAAWHAVDRWRP